MGVYSAPNTAQKNLTLASPSVCIAPLLIPFRRAVAFLSEASTEIILLSLPRTLYECLGFIQYRISGIWILTDTEVASVPVILYSGQVARCFYTCHIHSSTCTLEDECGVSGRMTTIFATRVCHCAEEKKPTEPAARLKYAKGVNGHDKIVLIYSNALGFPHLTFHSRRRRCWPPFLLIRGPKVRVALPFEEVFRGELI